MSKVVEIKIKYIIMFLILWIAGAILLGGIGYSSLSILVRRSSRSSVFRSDFWLDSRLVYSIFSPDGSLYGVNLSEDVEHLRASSSYIIRAEIVSAAAGVWHAGDESVGFHYCYTIYRVRVLGVFQGFIQTGNYIDVIQYERRRTRVSGRRDRVQYFIYVPFEVGDDVLLFLLSSNTDLGRPVILVNSRQGAYRYTPREIRAEYDNWVFENLHDERIARSSRRTRYHSIFNLTEQDIIQIKNTTGGLAYE